MGAKLEGVLLIKQNAEQISRELGKNAKHNFTFW